MQVEATFLTYTGSDSPKGKCYLGVYQLGVSLGNTRFGMVAWGPGLTRPTQAKAERRVGLKVTEKQNKGYQIVKQWICTIPDDAVVSASLAGDILAMGGIEAVDDEIEQKAQLAGERLLEMLHEMEASQKVTDAGDEAEALSRLLS